MSMRQRHRQIQARNESIASTGERNGSPCQQDGHGDSQVAKIMACSIPELPEVRQHRILKVAGLHCKHSITIIALTGLTLWTMLG
uniref:Uncharacterized protein n=1 Tax=Arundo donax TaxID=35708 RepID=A0A0A9C637_ARUDO